VHADCSFFIAPLAFSSDYFMQLTIQCVIKQILQHLLVI
jgi:hypothetical protein